MQPAAVATAPSCHFFTVSVRKASPSTSGGVAGSYANGHALHTTALQRACSLFAACATKRKNGSNASTIASVSGSASTQALYMPSADQPYGQQRTKFGQRERPEIGYGCERCGSTTYFSTCCVPCSTNTDIRGGKAGAWDSDEGCPPWSAAAAVERKPEQIKQASSRGIHVQSVRIHCSRSGLSGALRLRGPGLCCGGINHSAASASGHLIFSSNTACLTPVLKSVCLQRGAKRCNTLRTSNAVHRHDVLHQWQ